MTLLKQSITSLNTDIGAQNTDIEIKTCAL